MLLYVAYVYEAYDVNHLVRSIQWMWLRRDDNILDVHIRKMWIFSHPQKSQKSNDRDRNNGEYMILFGSIKDSKCLLYMTAFASI